MTTPHRTDPINPADLARAPWVLPDGGCPGCRKPMFRDFVLLTRVVVIGPQRSVAKCSQCKAWVKVPVRGASTPGD